NSRPLARSTIGKLQKLPSSAEEGKADAVAAAGVVLVNKIILLISTTPSARAEVASRLFLCRAATPPHLRRGVLLSKINACCGEGFEGRPGGPQSRETGLRGISGNAPRLRILSGRPWNSLPIRPDIAAADSCRR